MTNERLDHLNQLAHRIVSLESQIDRLDKALADDSKLMAVHLVWEGPGRRPSSLDGELFDISRYLSEIRGQFQAQLDKARKEYEAA